MTDFFEGTDQVSTPSVADQAAQTQTPAELQMIGEGRKYKSIEDADKALVENNNFIEKLKAENKERDEKIASLTSTLTKQETLDKALQFAQQKEHKPEQTSGSTPTSANAVATLTPEQIRELAKETYHREAETASQERNRLEVANTWKKLHGTRAEEKFIERLEKLGLSKEQMSTLARSSPKAALELLNPAETPVPSTGYSYSPSRELNIPIYNAATDTKVVDDIRQKIKLKMLPPEALDNYYAKKYKV